MIVVPLLVNGETIGTLNIGRMGEAEAHFSPQRVRADQAVRRPGLDRAAERRGPRRGPGPRRPGRPDRAAQPRRVPARARRAARRPPGQPFATLMLDLDEFKTFNDSLGHPAGDALLVGIAQAMAAATRDGDHLYRYGGDEFAAILPGADRVVAHEVAERIRAAVGRRRSRGRSARTSRSVPASPASRTTAGPRTRWSRSPTARCTWPSPAAGPRPPAASDDPYLRALDETALALLDRRDSDGLLETIVGRAPAPCSGRRTGTSTSSSRTAAELVVATDRARSPASSGTTRPSARGSAGASSRPAQPLAIDDYDTLDGARADVPTRRARRGRRRAADLGGGEVVGVLGLASGSSGRPFRARGTSTRCRASPSWPRSCSTTPGSSTSPSVAPCTTRRPACRTASS